MIGDANSESRDGANIALIGLHTSQGDGTADSLGHYCLTHGVSYHTIVDNATILPFVDPSRAAWSMLKANPISLNLCFVGWAEWTPGDWILHNYGMLRNGAAVVRAWSQRYHIPLVHLSPALLGAGRLGVIGHIDWTVLEQHLDPHAKDSHWDPGPGFPYEEFLNIARLPLEDMVIDNFPQTARSGELKLIVPIGSASAITEKAWVSISPTGGTTTARIFVQTDNSGIVQWDWTLTKDKRRVQELPNGTTQLTIQWQAESNIGICLEALPKKV